MKLIQDTHGQWHNTAIISTISVQPRGTASYGVVIEEINNDGVGHTIEVSLSEGEEGRREAHAILDRVVEWLCCDYPFTKRESDTYPLLEKERRDKAEREAALRLAQKRMVSEG